MFYVETADGRTVGVFGSWQAASLFAECELLCEFQILLDADDRDLSLPDFVDDGGTW